MKNRDYKSESIREFNRSADHYDDHAPFYYRMTRLCDESITDYLKTVCEPTAHILDVGCGTGALLEKIRRQFPEAHLNGIDISSKMLTIARKRNIPNAEFVEGDSEDLPYDTCSFDIIICSSSFHHYPNPDMAISEFKRVLKPGGYVIICDMDLPAIARLFANHILFPVQHKGDVRVYTRHEIKSLLENHGFSNCQVKKISAFEWMATGLRIDHT